MTFRSKPLIRIFILLPALLLSSAANANPFGDSLVVVLSGGMRGRADGCGCSSGPQGGLDRRATLIRETLAGADFIGLDCGGILDLDPEGGMSRSRCAMLGLARQSLKVMGVSTRDLFYGIPYLRKLATESGVHLVSANLVSDNQTCLFEEWTIIEHSGVTIAVTGLSKAIAPRTGIESGWATLEPESLVTRLSLSRPPDAEIVILLTDLEEVSLRRFLDSTDIFDYAFTSSRQVYSLTPLKVGRCTVQRPDADGRSLDAAILPRLKTPAGGRFINTPITLRTKSDTETTAWLKECSGAK